MTDSEEKLEKAEETLARYEQQVKEARAMVRKLRVAVAEEQRLRALQDKAAEAEKLLEFMKSIQTADGMSVFEAYMVLKGDDAETSEDAAEDAESATEDADASDETDEDADSDADNADASDLFE